MKIREGRKVSSPDAYIKAAGFAIEDHRFIEESISGSVATKERPGFIKLLDRMERGDVLVVTKLDRLGRNTMDVRATVEQLADSGIRVHCLALGGVDLTSPAEKRRCRSLLLLPNLNGIC